MRRSTSSALVGAVAAAALLSSASPAAADGYAITDVDITPVLADAPYEPVLVGDAGEDGDPSDCSITGFEEGLVGVAHLGAATGCGGIGFELLVTPPAGADAVVARPRATATATYGCVHPRTGRTRTTLVRTGEVTGYSGVFVIPVVDREPTELSAYALFTPEDVDCRGKERPAQLSITVEDLEVTLEPFTTSGPTQVVEVPGRWTVEAAPASRPGRP